MIKNPLLFFGLALALILYLYWQHDNATPEKKASISQVANQVSLQTGFEAKGKTTKSIKKQLRHKPFQASDVIENKEPLISSGNNDWSYLAIYRRLEWADVCERYFWYAFRNKDNPAADFVTEFTQNGHHENQATELDPLAVAGLNRYQSRCEALQKTVFAYAQVDQTADTKSNSVALELQHLLDSTPAKSKKEKRIQSTTELIKTFYQSRKAVEEIKKQSNKLTDEQRSKIYQEMRSLSLEIEGLSDVLDSQEALVNYEFLVTEIKKLDDQLVNQYDTETEAYQAAWSHLLQQWITLQSRLIGDDPDVFKMVKLASEWSSHISALGVSVSQYRKDMGFPLQSPGEQMMESFGVQTAHAFSEAANPAAILYLCGLGYDCGAGGSLAMQLCLLYYTAIPMACKLSVQDFYLNHALSPNLLEDVLTLYQWMEENYGA